MNASPSKRVRGAVTRHEAYGFYVDFGGESDGLVVITMIARDGSEPNPTFPPVGTVIDAVILGHTEIGGQPRLSIRPQDLESQQGPDE